MSLSIYFIKMLTPSRTLPLHKGEGAGGGLEEIDRCALWC
jgi:hypothetical protein